MLNSPARYAFQMVRSALSPVIVPEHVQASIEALIEGLAELGGAQYLECRLGQSATSPVDFLVSVSKLQRHVLATLVDAGALPGPGLSAFRRLLSMWTHPGSLLNEAVPVTWLEFDDASRQCEPTASVCASVVPSYIDPYVPLTSQGDKELLATLLDCVSVIRDKPCSVDEAKTLLRLVGRLPSGAHWIHLSVMTARSPVDLKLYGVFPRATLGSYLQAIAWRGDHAALEYSIDRYCPQRSTGDSLYVDLSLNQLLSSGPCGLGLCLSQQQVRSSAEPDPRRRALLAALRSDALCSEQEEQALADWPGSDEHRVGSQPWKLERWLDVKLVHRPDTDLLAKAYLGFSASPISGFSLRVPHSRGVEPCPQPGRAEQTNQGL